MLLVMFRVIITNLREDKTMANWSYGNRTLPSEHLEETQNTGTVKNAIKALESSYAAYKGYMQKATAGSQDGSITDIKSYNQALQSLVNLKKAVSNTKEVLQSFQQGLVTGNKKLGGGLDAKTLDTLIKTCESQFDKIVDNMKKKSDKNNNQNNQQNAQLNQNNQVANQVAAKAQSLNINPNTPISQLTPEQLQALAK